MTLPTITQKQQEILKLLYRFRFLHRIQIQQLLNHKDHKTTNLWLKDLTQKNYITRNYDTKFETRNKPAQYHIAKNGIIYFKTNSIFEKQHLTKFYKESKITQKFRDRCMFIADIYLELLRQDQDITFFTQSDFPTEGVIRDIMPSFGFIQIQNNEKRVYIAEIFQEKQPRYSTRARIKKYVEFFKNEPNTVIIFNFPSDQILKYSMKFTSNLVNEESFCIPILFTTSNSIKDTGWNIALFKKLNEE